MKKTDPSESIPDSLASVGFRAERDAIAAWLTHAHKSRLGPTEAIEQLVALERRARETTNLERRTRASCLGRFKPIDRFDWNHPRKIDRALVERLLSLDFVAEGDNVLLRGPSGIAKTMLAKNFGHAALLAGYSVRFTTLAAAIGDLVQQESVPAFERRLKRYVRTDLLLIDELGYLPSDNRAADILYQLISRRHEQRSIVITTNLSFKQWGAVFQGAACVVALVDRFAQHCHRVEIDGPSWREAHPFERDESESPRTPSRKMNR
jgi:DNA replication protein DnaC